VYAKLFSVAENTAELGTVVEVSTGLCRVDVDGQELLCTIRGSLSAKISGYTNVVAVGDEVLISAGRAGHGVVESVLPRRSALARPDTYSSGGRMIDRHRQQVIAANVDMLLIVASWREPHFWPELVDRYLITAERNDFAPLICVNKIDLAEELSQVEAVLKPYYQLGYRALFTSARSGHGIDRLRKLLRGHTTVLAGMSGAGKSSLLATLQPGLDVRTNAVSARGGQGRHTTAQVNLVQLDFGGAVIDTPGIREFGLGDLEPEELIHFYPDIADAQQACRFSNCSHTHEPDCGVKQALRNGRLSETRYHNYTRIYEELCS
jgi:ribosome biogenesis GTPase